MTFSDPHWGLPDPDTHSEFYSDVTIKRFLAFLVDTVLILLLAIIAIPFTAFIGLFVFGALYLAVALVYRIVSMSNWSATPGMRLLNIEFRTGAGQRFDLSTAAAHTVLYMIFFAVFPLQIVSIILMLTTARGQGLHDLALGTAAINRASVH